MARDCRNYSDDDEIGPSGYGIGGFGTGMKGNKTPNQSDSDNEMI